MARYNWSTCCTIWAYLIAFSHAKITSFEPANSYTPRDVKVGLVTDENPMGESKVKAKGCFKYGYDYLGNDLSETPLHDVTDPAKCQEMCTKNPRCKFFALNARNDPVKNNGCWLKDGAGTLMPREKVIFGPKNCEDKDLLSIMKDPLDVKQKEIVDQVSALLGSTVGLMPEYKLEHGTKSPLHELSKNNKERDVSKDKIKKGYANSIELMEQVTKDMDKAIQENNALKHRLRGQQHQAPQQDGQTNTKLLDATHSANEHRHIDSNSKDSKSISNNPESLHENTEGIATLSKLVSMAKEYEAATNNRSIPKSRNMQKDLLFVEDTLKRINDEEQNKNKMKRVSSDPCHGPNCNKDITEADFKNLELEAEAIMHALEGKYSHVLEQLHDVDKELLKQSNEA